MINNKPIKGLTSTDLQVFDFDLMMNSPVALLLSPDCRLKIRSSSVSLHMRSPQRDSGPLWFLHLHIVSDVFPFAQSLFHLLP